MKNEGAEKLANVRRLYLAMANHRQLRNEYFASSLFLRQLRNKYFPSSVVPSIVGEQKLCIVFVPSIVEEQILWFVFVPSIVQEGINSLFFVPLIVEGRIYSFRSKFWNKQVRFPLISKTKSRSKLRSAFVSISLPLLVVPDRGDRCLFIFL